MGVKGEWIEKSVSGEISGSLATNRLRQPCPPSGSSDWHLVSETLRNDEE